MSLQHEEGMAGRDLIYKKSIFDKNLYVMIRFFFKNVEMHWFL